MSSIYRGEKNRYDLAGEIDDEGKVWRGKKWDANLIGEVDEEGQVWQGDKSKHRLAGAVDSDGRIWLGEKWKHQLAGEVDPDGRVWAGKKQKYKLAGEIDPPSIKGGAALLLLLSPEAERKERSWVKDIALGVAADTISRRRSREDAPTQPASSRHPRKQAPTKMGPLQRVIGMAQASVSNVFWLNDPNETVALLLRQSSPPDSASERNQMLTDQREVLRDVRPFIVVVGGDRDYILHALRELQMADLIVICADSAVLENLRIPIADASWRPGRKQLGYSFFHDLVTRKRYRGPVASDILAAAGHSPKGPREESAGSVDKETHAMLRVGNQQISIDDAMALIAGYCYAERSGRWDDSLVAGAPYARELPDVTWRRWAYRSYDCLPRTSHDGLDALDVLAPVGLNVVQGYGTELVERLTAVSAHVNEAMAAVPTEATFWEIDPNEIEPAGTPRQGSVSWAIHRSWALLMAVPGIGVTITHKILHHRWPNLFPLIDSQTLNHLKEGEAWLNVHADITSQEEMFSGLEEWFDTLHKERGGVHLGRLRLHDILLWCLATGEHQEAIKAGRALL